MRSVALIPAWHVGSFSGSGCLVMVAPTVLRPPARHVERIQDGVVIDIEVVHPSS